MEDISKLKNKTIVDLEHLLVNLESVNFEGSNNILYNKIQKNILIIKNYKQLDINNLSNNKDKICIILNLVLDYNTFINNILLLVDNIKKIEISISKIDTSGTHGTITPSVYSKLEASKYNIIDNLFEYYNLLLQFNTINECKIIMLNQFNKPIIELVDVQTFIEKMDIEYLKLVTINKSKYIINFIYDIYNQIFYYISGKKNQKIISEYILKNIYMIKNTLLKEYKDTNVDEKNRLDNLNFIDNSRYSISQKMIQTNNLNPATLYDNLKNIFKNYVGVDIPNTEIDNKTLFDTLGNMLSTNDIKIGFVVFYKYVETPVEQQILTIISNNRKYINYVNSGINDKIINNTRTIKYLEKYKKSENVIKIYNDNHIKIDNTTNVKNIFYILDTMNDKDFRFLTPYNYGSNNLRISEVDIQFLIDGSYPKKKHRNV